ncbi:MAG: hypothetical protein Udaeo2_20810 [Candidatus Udaeobacter sp.]|nr:MAG: hypothetical protein Udaeo2_20810 [Candidatus Udaeobacter sp.]
MNQPFFVDAGYYPGVRVINGGAVIVSDRLTFRMIALVKRTSLVQLNVPFGITIVSPSEACLS